MNKIEYDETSDFHNLFILIPYLSQYFIKRCFWPTTSIDFLINLKHDALIIKTVNLKKKSEFIGQYLQSQRQKEYFTAFVI